MYPNYPNNRLIVNGVDLTEEFKMVLVDGYTLGPPTPKVYTIDIPGRSGAVDLSEVLNNDISYNNRSQSFTFYVINIEDFETVKTDISNFLHGRRYEYVITMDPDYIYTGRFTINSYTHSVYSNIEHKVGVIEVSVDAEPYKRKENVKRKINCYGGNIIHLYSGRLMVRPKFTVTEKAVIDFNNKEYILDPAELTNWILCFCHTALIIYTLILIVLRELIIQTFKV